MNGYVHIVVPHKKAGGALILPIIVGFGHYM